MDDELKSLKGIWQLFMKSKPDEKYFLLRRFLSDFYSFTRKHDGELPRFSDRQSMCNLLVREIRADIALCCTRSTSDGDMRPFVHYFQQDRGWLLLYTLWKLDIMEVHLARDFASIVISLLRSIGVGDHEADESAESLPMPTADLSLPLPSLKRLKKVVIVPSVFDASPKKRQRKTCDRPSVLVQKRQRYPIDSDEEKSGLRERPVKTVDLRKLQSKVIFDLYLSDETLQDLVSDSERPGRVPTRPSPLSTATLTELPHVEMWTVKTLMLQLMFRLCVDVNNSELLPDVLPGLMDILEPQANASYLSHLLRLVSLVGVRLIEAGHVVVLLGNGAMQKLLSLTAVKSLRKDVTRTCLQLLSVAFFQDGRSDEETLRLFAAWEEAGGSREVEELCQQGEARDVLQVLERLLLSVKAHKLAHRPQIDPEPRPDFWAAHHVSSLTLPSSRCVPGLLTRLLVNIATSCPVETATHSLDILRRCGSCCCVPARDHLLPLLHADLPPPAADQALCVVVDVMAREYGGAGGPVGSCAVCTASRDSAERWDCLRGFREVVLERAESPGAMRHLLVLVRAAEEPLRVRILHEVVLPGLVSIRDRLQTDEEVGGPIQAVCRLLLLLLPLLPCHVRRQRLADQMAEVITLSRVAALRRPVYRLIETLVRAGQRRGGRGKSAGPDLAFSLVEYILSVGSLERCILAEDEEVTREMTRQLHENTDIWMTYQRLFFHSETFRSRFYEKNGFSGAYLLLKDVMRSFKTSPVHQDQYRLFRALLILVFETCKMNKEAYQSYSTEVILLSLARLCHEVIPYDDCEIVTTVLDNVLNSCTFRGYDVDEPLCTIEVGGNLDTLINMVFRTVAPGPGCRSSEPESMSRCSSAGDISCVYDADDDASSDPREELGKDAALGSSSHLVHPDLVSLLVMVVTNEAMCDRAMDSSIFLGLQRRYLSAVADTLRRGKAERRYWDLLSVTLDRIEALSLREVPADLWPLLFGVVQAVVAEGIDVFNLRRIFDLLKNKALPPEEIFSCLHCMACCEDLGPASYLHFPVSVHHDESVSCSNVDFHADSAAALSVSLLNESSSWPCRFSAGFAVSLWLSFNWPASMRNSKYRGRKGSERQALSQEDLQASFLHIMSVGHSLTRLEVWCDPTSTYIYFRLVDHGKVIGETGASLMIHSNTWFHLFISVQPEKTTLIRMSLSVNGSHVKDVSLKHSIYGEGLHRIGSLCVGLGHADTYEAQVRRPKTYNLGAVNFFSNSVRRPDDVIYLFSLGPDWIGGDTHNAETDYSSVRDYFLRRFVSESNCSRTQDTFQRLATESNWTCGALPDLCFSLSPLDSRRVVYRSVASDDEDTGFLRRFKSGSPASKLVFVSTSTEFELRAQPSTAFASSLQPFGGVKALLYGFARTVGECRESRVHAAALEVLLKAVVNSPRLSDEFKKNDCTDLLLSVLTHARCRVDKNILTVLLQYCVSKPLWTITGEDLVICPEPLAFVINADFIQTVMLSWKLWDTLEPSSLQNSLMKTFGTLVAGDNRFQRLNIRRLVVEAELPPVVLQNALEQWMEVGRLPLPGACSHLVDLIGESWGSPPDTAIIRTVFRTIQLLHPESVTEILHKPSLYFQNLKTWTTTSRRGHAAGSQVYSTDSGALSSCGSISSSSSTSSASSSNDSPLVGKDSHTSRPDLRDLETTRMSAFETQVMRDFYRRCISEDGHGSDPDVHSGDEEEDPEPTPRPQDQPKPGMTSIQTTLKRKSHSHRDAPAEKAAVECQDESVSVLMSGLLLLLRDLIHVQLPDALVEPVLQQVIRADSLAVLGLSPLSAVREAVLQLFSCCTLRARRGWISQVSQTRLVTLLANQLHQHAATDGLVRTGLRLLVDLPREPGLGRHSVILALLEKTAAQPKLCYLALTSLFDWLGADESRMVAAVEGGLCEALVNTLQATLDSPEAGDVESVARSLVLVGEYLFFVPEVEPSFQDLVRLLVLLQRQQSEMAAEGAVRSIVLDLFHAVLGRVLADTGFRLPSKVVSWSRRRTLSVALAEASRESVQLFFELMVDFVLFECRSEGLEAELGSEGRFLEQIHNVLFLLMTRIIRKPGLKVLEPLDAQLWQLRDVLRLQYLRLLLHLCGSKQPFQRRLSVIRTLISHESGEQILNLCLSTSLGTAAGQELSECIDDIGSGEFLYQELDLLRRWLQRRNRSQTRDQQDWRRIHEEQRSQWILENERTLAKWRFRIIAWAEPLSKLATGISSQIDYEHKCSKKQLMMSLRDRRAQENLAQTAWSRLNAAMTHPRAVWYESKASPAAWELDPTENGIREHRRMRPVFLDNLPPSFFKDESKSVCEHSLKHSPIHFLLSRGDKDRSVLHRSEEAAPRLLPCRLVAPSCDLSGQVVICSQDMHFLSEEEGEGNEKREKFPISGPGVITWKLEDIQRICRRRFELRDTAIEIFLVTGSNHLLSFQTCKRRDEVLEHLRSVLPPVKFSFSSGAEVQARWVRGELTNFDYLMHLNTLAGRSYNDLMQYPVFPFVLSDFTSEELDLSVPESFRHLHRPVSVQHRSSEQRYREKFNTLERQYREMSAEFDYVCPPYHYASHYSNSGTVLHYLLRLPSFTTVFIHYQDSHFDLPDRTFHSISTTWNLCSWQSESDVKELIPEFFFLPEFFENSAGFNLGLRQNGLPVDRVILPPWANDDPRLFTLIHRAALESPHVTANLCKWIDLIFGFKQCGKRAVQEINIYHPYTYYGAIDPDAIDDPVRRRAVQTMIRTYGQTPEQLFRGAPHPAPRELEWRGAVVDGLQVRGLRWGPWVGAPTEGEPCAWLPVCPPARGLLNVFGEVVGLGEGVCGVEGHPGALLWSSPDHTLRYRGVEGQGGVIALREMSLHARPTAATAFTSPLCRQTASVVVGYQSGVVHVSQLGLDESRPRLFGTVVVLTGHCDPVVVVEASPAFYLLLTGDAAGGLCVWDTNTWTLVRELHNDLAGNLNASFCVSAATVSATMGDIAVVFNSDNGCHSHLRVWTLNGRSVGSSTFPANSHALSLAYTALPEGRNINALAVGLASGAVELRSSWTLALVRRVDLARLTEPGLGGVVAVRFSADARRLFAVGRSGGVVCVETSDEVRGKANRQFVVVTFV